MLGNYDYQHGYSGTGAYQSMMGSNSPGPRQCAAPGGWLENSGVLQRMLTGRGPEFKL